MQKAIIYDLEDESGPAMVLTHSVNAAEAVERDPKRYVRKLPEGVKLGPKNWPNPVIWV
jgi:hypothetical protein